MHFFSLKKISKHIAFFLKHDEKGAFAVIFAIMMIPLMAFAGAAVDYSEASRIKKQLISAADSSVLAGARAASTSDDDAFIREVARKVFRANLASSVVLGEVDFIFTHTNDGVRVDAKTKMKTSFLPLIGMEYLDVAVFSEATSSSSQIEVALVLDNTGSMSGGKIISLIQAATSLVNELMPQDRDNAISIGLVPFAKYVNIGMANRNEPNISVPADNGDFYWRGCVGSRNDPWDERDRGYNSNEIPGLLWNDDYGLPSNPLNVLDRSWHLCTTTPITRLTTAKAGLIDGLNSMSARGMTYIPAGLLWGWNLLSDNHPFDDARPYDSDNKKVLVLMTDGSNTRAPTYPEHNIGNSALANAKTQKLCDNIKDEEIVVFTIAFEIFDNTIKNILDDCAGNGGGYFDAGNANELQQAFDAITQSIMEMRLTK